MIPVHTSDNEGIWEGIVNMVHTFVSQKRTATLVICWGSMVGINWTYSNIFGVIFSGHKLTE